MMFRFTVWVALVATTVPVVANDGLLRLAGRARRCNTITHSQRVIRNNHVQPFVVADTPDVFVIQNSTPTPLVAQGSTGYVANTYTSSVLPFLDPNVYFQQELALIRAADQTAAARAQRTAALVERVVELQAPAVERAAAGDAAAKILKAAGLVDTGKSLGTMNSVVIKTAPDGRLVVEPVTLPHTPKGPASVDGLGLDTAPSTLKGSQAPLATKYCAACHGTHLQDPKGGFYIGPGKDITRVLREEWFSVTNRVSAGTMPPQGSPQPTDAERAGILNEIEDLILEGE